MINTSVLYVVGTGPRLQMLLNNPEHNKKIESDFSAWADEISFARKLQTIIRARRVDGEGFGLLYTNQMLRHQVKLDLMPFECDHVQGEFSGTTDARDIDGIKIDEYGNEKTIRVLKDHPGANYFGGATEEATYFPADSVIHTYRETRPGQHRGLSEIMAALPLYAYLRRLTLAVISAYENAASVAGFFSSELPYGEEEAQPTWTAAEEISIRRDMFMFLPAGMKPFQMKSEHPSAMYAEFKHEILNEIARILNLPYNIAALNSSGYNYSSGRLDHQVFFKSVYADQIDINKSVLDARVWQAWLDEYILNNTWVLETEEFKNYGTVPHTWFWDGYEDVDPVKEALANEKNYKNKMVTLSQIYGRKGKDYEKELRQYARELELMKELGITQEEALQLASKE